jgi:hypothetical protein
MEWFKELYVDAIFCFFQELRPVEVSSSPTNTFRFLLAFSVALLLIPNQFGREKSKQFCPKRKRRRRSMRQRIIEKSQEGEAKGKTQKKIYIFWQQIKSVMSGGGGGGVF